MNWLKFIFSVFWIIPAIVCKNSIHISPIVGIVIQVSRRIATIIWLHYTLNYFIFENLRTENLVHSGAWFCNQNAVKLTCKHLACQKISGVKLPDPQENREEGERERGGRGWRAEELVSTTFQTKVTPLHAGKHTSNNRSTTRLEVLHVDVVRPITLSMRKNIYIYIYAVHAYTLLNH
jgi:hypothetical protein